MVQAYSSPGMHTRRRPTIEDCAEELFENFATEMEVVVKRYAPKVRELYKRMDARLLNGAIDWVVARMVRALELEAGYEFNGTSVNNIEDYIEHTLFKFEDIEDLNL